MISLVLIPCSHTISIECLVLAKVGLLCFRPPKDAGMCQQWVPLQLTVYANLRSSSAYTRSGWGVLVRVSTRGHTVLLPADKWEVTTCDIFNFCFLHISHTHVFNFLDHILLVLSLFLFYFLLMFFSLLCLFLLC